MLLRSSDIVFFHNSKKEHTEAHTIVKLMRCEDCQVQMQANFLLRSIALADPDCCKTRDIIEEAFESLTCISVDESLEGVELDADKSPNPMLLYSHSLTLAAVCQVHPKLSRGKLDLAFFAIREFLRYENEDIVSYPCVALAHLFDGSEAVLIESESDYFKRLIVRLSVLIDSDSRVNIISGLVALGNIVRWGDDNHIQVLIDEDVLTSLRYLVGELGKHFVKDSCWILSNITAREQKHIQAVLDCECIGPLVGVVCNYHLLDVRKEAAWAILNAICRGSSSQIENLRKKCVKPLWDSLEVCSNDLRFVCACLEGLAKLKGLTVTCNGEPMDDVEFGRYLVELQRRPFQLANFEGLKKFKKRWTIDNNDVVFYLTVEEDPDQGLQQ